MGVINLTPDSFSDGGQFKDAQHAYSRLLQYFEEGADIVDIGAESTRPRAKPVSVAEEWQRLLPLLKLLAQTRTQLPVSVDTYKPEIMARLLDYPLTMINDTKSSAPPELLCRIAKQGLHYISMHMYGEPSTMQEQPLTADEVMPTLLAFFRKRLAILRKCGFADKQALIDPGIGFGKSDRATMRIFTNLNKLTAVAPVAIGVSRKSWLGRNFNLIDPLQRDDLSSMLAMALIWQGAKLIRAHDVRRLVRLKELFDHE